MSKLSEEQLALLAPHGVVEKDTRLVHLLEMELTLKAKKLSSGSEDDKLGREIEKKLMLYIKRCALAAVYYMQREGEEEAALAADCVKKVELYGSEDNPLKEITTTPAATSKLMLFGYEELVGMYTALGYEDTDQRVIAARGKVATYTNTVKHEKKIRKLAKVHLASKMLMQPLVGEEEDGEGDEKGKKKKKKKKKVAKKVEQEGDLDVSCVEESDDVDDGSSIAESSVTEASGTEEGAPKKKKKKKVKASKVVAKEGFVDASLEEAGVGTDGPPKEDIKKKLQRLQALKKMKKAAIVASVTSPSDKPIEAQPSAGELFKQALEQEKVASPTVPQEEEQKPPPQDPDSAEPPAPQEEPASPGTPPEPAGTEDTAAEAAAPADVATPPERPMDVPHRDGDDEDATTPRVIHVQAAAQPEPEKSGITVTRSPATRREEPPQTPVSPLDAGAGVDEPGTPGTPQAAADAAPAPAATPEGADVKDAVTDTPGTDEKPPATTVGDASPFAADPEAPPQQKDVVEDGGVSPRIAVDAPEDTVIEERRRPSVKIPDGMQRLKRPKAPPMGKRRSIFDEERQADAWMSPLSPAEGHIADVKPMLGPSLPEDMFHEAKEVQGLEDFRYLDKQQDAKVLTADRKHQLTMAVLKGRDAKFRLLAKDVSRHFTEELVNQWVRLAASAGSPALVSRLIKDYNADPDETDGETGLALVHQATRSGHTSVVAELLRHGADVDPLDCKQRTPLHLACIYGERDTALLLIKHGADVKHVDMYFNTPLQYASSCQLKDVQSMLVKNGALDHIYTSDADATQRLLTACERAEEDVALLLIDHGAADLGYCEDTSPLHLCCLNEMKEAVQLLLVKGVSVDPISSTGQTPLHITSCLNVEIVKILTSGGAQAEVEDRHGNTALHYACRSHREDIACLLIARAPQIINHGNQSGTTALHMAVTEGLPKVLRALFTSGADLNALDEMRNTPLHLACSLEKPGFAAALIHQGCEVDLYNHAGYPPILYACSSRMSDVAIQLIKRGCNVNVADKSGYTVLHYACANSMSVVCWALFKVPNVEVVGRSRSGVTILHVAASSNLKDVLETLLVRGCHIGAVDRRGNTALHYACLHQCPEAAEFLLAMGAKPNVVNQSGHTPLDYAVLAHGEEQRPSSSGVASRQYSELYKLRFKKAADGETDLEAPEPAEQVRSPGFIIDDGAVGEAVSSPPDLDSLSGTEACTPHIAADAAPCPSTDDDHDGASSVDGWTNPQSSQPATPAEQPASGLLTRDDGDVGFQTPMQNEVDASQMLMSPVASGLPPRHTPRQAMMRPGSATRGVTTPPLGKQGSKGSILRRPSMAHDEEAGRGKRPTESPPRKVSIKVGSDTDKASVTRPGSASSRQGSVRSNPSILRRYSDMALRDTDLGDDDECDASGQKQEQKQGVVSPSLDPLPGMGYDLGSDDEEDCVPAL